VDLQGKSGFSILLQPFFFDSQFFIFHKGLFGDGFFQELVPAPDLIALVKSVALMFDLLVY
jgi:hypothetical protein